MYVTYPPVAKVEDALIMTIAGSASCPSKISTQIVGV